MDILETIRERMERDINYSYWNRFCTILQRWERKPYPLDEFLQRLTPYLDVFPNELFIEYKKSLLENYPTEVAKALDAQEKRDKDHGPACERQLGSPLLSLPREIREQIWRYVLRDNVIHVSIPQIHEQKRRTVGRPKRPKYLFHLCTAPRGIESAATPPGELGDHFNCDVSGLGTAPSINVVCTQTYLETLQLKSTFYSQNAFQFPDLETAEDFIFHLSENQRASIPHLKIAITFDMMVVREAPGIGTGMLESWQAICNYFSNPWDRRTLGMYPRKEDKPWMIKEPIYFYYSSCYWHHNRDRMHKRWQVGRGNTSWDIGISNLRHRGCPRLDLAMKVPTNIEEENGINSPWRTDFSRPKPWLTPLLQFHSYDGLDVRLYDESGLTTTFEFEVWAEELKEHLAGPKIGPRVCAFFAGRPHGNGEGVYM